MVTQLVFQICKMPVNGIGCIGDVQFRLIIPGEEPRQIGLQAPVCTAQFPVGIVAFSRFVLTTLIEKILPLGVPGSEPALKALPISF